MSVKTVAVICPTEEDKENLRRCRLARQLKLVFIGDGETAWQPGFNMRSFIQEQGAALRRLNPDAILGTDDYPACPLAALFAEQLGLPAPSLRSVLLCQHKGASRRLQQDVLPRDTPAFQTIDVDAPDGHPPFPFFLKPVKSYLSYLAERVGSRNDLLSCIARARSVLPPFTQPMEALVAAAGNGIAFNWRQLIAEELIGGRQVTLDGLVAEGEVQPLGVVDSIRYPNRFSFKRFDCPSSLPVEVQQRMGRMAAAVMKAARFDNSMFNIEFFYNPDSGSIRIIEVNSRMSCQFATLYEAVRGVNSYDLQLALALGKQPKIPDRGPFRLAASFVPRFFQDRLVVSTPTGADVAAVQRRFPEGSVDLLIKSGMRLSEAFQDGKSFRYVIVNAAAQTRKELFIKYRQMMALLPFRFES